MSKNTQRYKRSFTGSVGSGMKSIMGGGSRRYYVLEHKISSKYHKAGESQRIIVDQIELGRDATCQVRFDESFHTVSRRHAAIIKDGDNWKLVQLSKTNSTYLNGRKIEKEWYLQSGDEIQLSTNGPKLGFIVPQGEKGLVKSIGMTARLNLFRQQALRPYKQALTALSCILLLCISIAGYIIYQQHLKTESLNQLVAETKVQWGKEKELQDSIIKNINKENAGLVAEAATRDAELDKLKKRVSELANRPVHTPSVKGTVDNNAIDRCLPHIFFIKTVKFDITFPTGEKKSVDCGEKDIPGWTGTGFLLDNGTFVTARHVSEAWYYWRDGSGTNELLARFNYIVNNGGKITAHFIAVSSGKQLTFTSDQFTCNRANDVSGHMEDGSKLSLAQLDQTDFAYMRTNQANGLPFDAQKSVNLERGAKLTVLGFPLGIGANAIDDINPIYGSGIVAAPGLQQGRIITTDTNYEQGNSGGPVFYEDHSGKLVVVGIVSAGAGRNTGFIVPISVIR